MNEELIQAMRERDDYEECGRHGGPWGGDETCARCTDEDGSVRPLPH